MSHMPRGYTARFWPSKCCGEPGWSYECFFNGRIVFEGWSRGKKRDARDEVRRGIANREALVSLATGKAA